MRNLKRALSLALAAIMVLGLMVIGAGAAYQDFTDKDEIQHEEAVKTLVALNVIAGKDNGSYDPTGTLTRAEMAKLVTYIMNGGNEPVLSTKPNPTYSDIGGHWAEKYIEYCSSQGIIAGDGAGKFNPEGTLTGSQAAKMLLVAMNYDANVFGFTGNSWEINVNKEANNAKLYEELGGMDPSATISRDDAAQLVYNAIQSDTMQLTWGQNMETGEVSQNYALTGDSLLESKFNADIYEGIMTASGEYALAGVSTVSEDRFSILADQKNNSPILAAGVPATTEISREYEDQDLTNLVGRRVKAIVHQTKDTVYGVYPIDAKNKVYIETTASKVSLADTNTKIKTSDVTYSLDSAAVYYVNGTRQGAAVAGGTIVAGLQALLGTDLATTKATGNNVVLISNNNDEKIDLIFVNTVAVAEVSYVGTETFSVANAVGTRGVNTDKNGYTAVNQKMADVVVDGELVAGAMVVISEDYYTTTDKYTVVEKQTGTVEGVRTNTASQNVEFQIDGEWYIYYGYGAPTPALNSGDSIEFVALGNVLYYTKKVEAADIQKIAFVITAADTVGVEAGISAGVPQAKLLFADGSKATVNTVDSNGDPDATVDTTMVGRMVTYTKTTSGDYILKLVGTGNTGGFDGVTTNIGVSGDHVGASNTGKVASIDGIDIADDAVVFIMNAAAATTANAANEAKVYTGKEAKSLAKGTYMTTGAVYTEVNGFKYAKVLTLTANAALPTTFTGKSYGYLVANAYESYDSATATTWRNYEIWTGTETIKVKEASNAGLTNLVAGATVVYDLVGDSEVKNVSVASGLITTQVTGYDGNKIGLVSEGSTKKITSDTVILYVDSAAKTGAEGGSIIKADDTDGNKSITAADDANVRYIVSSSDSSELALLVVDVKNKMADAPDLKVAGTTPSADVLNNALTNGNVVLTDNGAVTLPVDLEVPAGRTLDASAAASVTAAAGAITLNGTLKVGTNVNVNLGAATTLTTGDKTVVFTIGTVTLPATATVNGTWTVGTLAGAATKLTLGAGAAVQATTANTVTDIALGAGASFTATSATGLATISLGAGAELNVTNAITTLAGASVTLAAGTASDLTVLNIPATSITTSALALVDNVSVTVKDLTSSGNFSGAAAGSNTNVTITGSQGALSVFAGNYTFKDTVTGQLTMTNSPKITFEKAVVIDTVLPAAASGDGALGAEVTFKTALSSASITANATSGDGFFTNDGSAALTNAEDIVVDVVYKLVDNAASGSNNGWVKQ